MATGAVFQPSVLVWGTMRTAFNTVARDKSSTRQDVAEWANRLDLFGEFRLSGTEQTRPNDDGTSPSRRPWARRCVYASRNPTPTN